MEKALMENVSNGFLKLLFSGFLFGVLFFCWVFFSLLFFPDFTLNLTLYKETSK